MKVAFRTKPFMTLVVGQQTWPPHITTYPDWSDRYTTMASSLDMPITDLDEAVNVIHAFIDAIDIS